MTLVHIFIQETLNSNLRVVADMADSKKTEPLIVTSIGQLFKNLSREIKHFARESSAIAVLPFFVTIQDKSLVFFLFYIN